MREIHADRRALAQDRGRPGVSVSPEQLGPHPQRLVGGMAEAEHPGVAARGPHRAANLVGECLEGQRLVRRREGAGERLARPGGCAARSGEDRDGLFETPFEHVAEPVVRHASQPRELRARRQMVAMNGRQKEQRAHALVEVRLAAAVSVERVGRRQQFGRGPAPAPPFDGPVSGGGVGRLDQVENVRAHDQSDLTASSSITCVSTRSLSRPESDSASCATRSPYGAPMS